MTSEFQNDKVVDFNNPWWQYWGRYFREPIIEMILKDNASYDLLKQQALRIALQNATNGFSKYPKTIFDNLAHFGDFCSCGSILSNQAYFTERISARGTLEIVYKCPKCQKYCFIEH